MIQRKNAKKASALEQTESLGSERALSNGSTMLRVMPNGDLVLSDHGEPVRGGGVGVPGEEIMLGGFVARLTGESIHHGVIGFRFLRI